MYVWHFSRIQNNCNMAHFPLRFFDILEGKEKYPENCNVQYVKGLFGTFWGCSGSTWEGPVTYGRRYYWWLLSKLTSELSLEGWVRINWEEKAGEQANSKSRNIRHIWMQVIRMVGEQRVETLLGASRAVGAEGKSEESQSYRGRWRSIPKLIVVTIHYSRLSLREGGLVLSSLYFSD